MTSKINGSPPHPPSPSPSGLGYCLFLVGGSIVVDSLFIVAPDVCGGCIFGPCFVMQYF